jgi:monothiol glutaredoxin
MMSLGKFPSTFNRMAMRMGAFQGVTSVVKSSRSSAQFFRGFHSSSMFKFVATQQPAAGVTPAADPVDPELEKMIAVVRKQVRSHAVFLYMKGNPQMPRCGFSQRVVMILNKVGVPYGFCDITEDNFAICDAVEAFSQWPTYPQLFISGELVGGSDITTELYRSGELQQMLAQAKALEPPASAESAAAAESAATSSSSTDSKQ